MTACFLLCMGRSDGGCFWSCFWQIRAYVNIFCLRRSSRRGYCVKAGARVGSFGCSCQMYKLPDAHQVAPSPCRDPIHTPSILLVAPSFPFEICNVFCTEFKAVTLNFFTILPCLIVRLIEADEHQPDPSLFHSTLYFSIW